MGWWLSLPVALGCQGAGDGKEVVSAMETPIVITDRGQIEAAVGRVVSLRGAVTNSRVPQLVGVEVESDDPDLRGKRATATGVLERWVVTQEEIDRDIARLGMFDHRGPGTFYRLADPVSGQTVQVQRPAD